MIFMGVINGICCLFSRIEDAVIGLDNEACGLVQELALGKMPANDAAFGNGLCCC